MDLYTEEYIYQALLSRDDIDKINNMNPDDFVHETVYDWCDETFGTDMWYNSYHEFSDIEVYAFKKIEHRDWFVLRWT